jgi:hypothetical protein
MGGEAHSSVGEAMDQAESGWETNWLDYWQERRRRWREGDGIWGAGERQGRVI